MFWIKGLNTILIYYVSIFTISLILSFICFLTDMREQVVKGIYPTLSWGCTIRLGLLIADFDAKYWLKWYVVVISLFAYVDALVSRPTINAVHMPYGYSLQPGGNVKIRKKKRYRISYSSLCNPKSSWNTCYLWWGTTTSDNFVETNNWLTKGVVTPIDIEVLATPTFASMGYSSIFGAFF